MNHNQPLRKLEFHRQRAGEPWRSMMLRLAGLRISAAAWHDYAIFTVTLGWHHHSLELGWRGHVRGVRVL